MYIKVLLWLLALLSGRVFSHCTDLIQVGTVLVNFLNQVLLWVRLNFSLKITSASTSNTKFMPGR